MSFKCLFGFHKYWKEIRFSIGESGLVWDELELEVCTNCGKVRGFVQGKDDHGKFRYVKGERVREFEEVKNKNW